MTTLVRVELEKLRTTGLPWALLAASTALTLALALHAGGPAPGGSWTYRSMYLRRICSARSHLASGRKSSGIAGFSLGCCASTGRPNRRAPPGSSASPKRIVGVTPGRYLSLGRG